MFIVNKKRERRDWNIYSEKRDNWIENEGGETIRDYIIEKEIRRDREKDKEYSLSFIIVNYSSVK